MIDLNQTYEEAALAQSKMTSEELSANLEEYRVAVRESILKNGPEREDIKILARCFDVYMSQLIAVQRMGGGAIPFGYSYAITQDEPTVDDTNVLSVQLVGWPDSDPVTLLRITSFYHANDRPEDACETYVNVDWKTEDERMKALFNAFSEGCEEDNIPLDDTPYCQFFLPVVTLAHSMMREDTKEFYYGQAEAVVDPVQPLEHEKLFYPVATDFHDHGGMEPCNRLMFGLAQIGGGSKELCVGVEFGLSEFRQLAGIPQPGEKRTLH